MAQVPKELISSKGLNAKEWCDQVKEIIDGKGGGKPENAQASGTKPQVNGYRMYHFGSIYFSQAWTANKQI